MTTGPVRKDVEQLNRVYAHALAQHGATARGLLWPNAVDLARRFEALLGPIEWARYRQGRPLRLLDLGCGPGLLLDYLESNALLGRVDYTGTDVLEATLDVARERWPGHRFEHRDLRDHPFPEQEFDFAIACGVFTGRFTLSHVDMEVMVRDTLTALWPSVVEGLSFNVMSSHVDWRRDDLFHWPLDTMMAFCKAQLSHFVSIRLDYGLWEVAASVRRAPVVSTRVVPASWSVDPSHTSSN